MVIKKYKTEKRKIQRELNGDGKVYPVPVFKRSKIILRIVDANLNRCREGLRVVEDSLRFIVNDDVLYKKIRNIRHNIDRILRDIYPELIKGRDPFGDPGREMHEVLKKDLHVAVIANFKRAQESMRVLEEYSKIFLPVLSAEFKKYRYETYIAEKLVYLRYRKFFAY
ncbi:MAG: hypothetical protein LBU29_02460 [Endomicrobium sp.]|jgi:thiamine-phosphate pyrophosphorylase|nr:hypothetical protein [Endomicrobium sp.]